MNQVSLRSPAKLAILLALPMAAIAQPPQQAGTLTIVGQPDHAAVVRINGRSYVEIESLARIAHGSLRIQGSQTILTLPGLTGTNASSVPPVKTPQLSGGYLAAEIEALSQIREWRAALAGAVQNNYPVTESWVGGLRRTGEAKLQLATAAATTEPDQRSVEFLRNAFTAMQQISQQFLLMRTKANYTPPDSFDNNALDQKVLRCQSALVSMAATKQFLDEPSCH
jgi:hypothetical protein